MSKQQLHLIGLCMGLLLILASAWLWITINQTAISTTTKFDRVVTTTNAQSQVFDELGIDGVVGIATPGAKQTVPERYKDAVKVGNHVSPNMEQIGTLKPDAVYVDAALLDDYQKRLTSDGIQTEILNFKTIADLQGSITQLGETFGKQAQAEKLNATLDLTDPKAKQHPKVLLLMGMPGGSFLAGTKYCYLGDLIERAGGQVITTSDVKSDYVQPNMEQIAADQPDVVITMAHAMEDSVFATFKSTLKSDAWRDIKAIKQDQVFEAKEPTFSMTANLNAPKAFKQIQTWLEKATVN